MSRIQWALVLLVVVLAVAFAGLFWSPVTTVPGSSSDCLLYTSDAADE